MDRGGTRYERLEEPEATVGAPNDNETHAVAHGDNPENPWPIYEGRGNTALALTQLDLDNGIEMTAIELKKMANIDEEMLRHGDPDTTPSDTSIHSHETDALMYERATTPDDVRHIDQQEQWSLGIEEQQVTSGADSHSPAACLKDESPSPEISPYLSSTRVTQSNGDAQSILEKGARISETTRPDETETPRLTSGCQLPCMNHSLKWLEERVVMLDAVLGSMESQDWMEIATAWETHSDNSVSSRYPHDEIAWFKKRVPLLCCCYDDLQALKEEGEGEEEIQQPGPFRKKQDAKSVQQRVRTNLLGNAVYRENVVWRLLDRVWQKEKTLPIFRLAILCIMLIGCAFTSDIDINIGQFLELAFSEEILPRPDSSDTRTWARYVLLTIGLVVAIGDQHTLYGGVPEDLVIEWDSNSGAREEDLLLTFSSLFCPSWRYDLRKKKSPMCSGVQDVESVASVSTSTNFDVQDLDIKSLKCLGGIHIKWTNTFVDHLRLELGDRNILYVCWMAHLPGYSPTSWYMASFRATASPVDTSYLMATKWHIGSYSRKIVSSSLSTALYTRRSIENSWAFLFREGVQSAAYQGLEAPIFIERPRTFRAQRWVRALIGRSAPEPEEPRTISMKTLISKPTASENFPEIKMHAGVDPFTNEETPYSRTVREAIQRNKELYYCDFPVYGERIRALRKYMDECKPRDFWGLLHDRRNTLQYYTFWSVIAVGLFSILLGLMSLAVGIAQAVFAYRALNLPIAATITSSTT